MPNRTTARKGMTAIKINAMRTLIVSDITMEKMIIKGVRTAPRITI